MTIQSVKGRMVLDSRGNPTVEVELSDGEHVARAMVPSGASTGMHEACELRDGGKAWNGKGVSKAIANVNDVIAPVIVGMSPENQNEFDQALLALDGTENKTNLGANAILAVSMASCRLASMQQGIPMWKHILQIFGGNQTPSLPRPMMNVINGGEHANNGISIQEFMLFPKLETFEKNLQAGVEIFHALKKFLEEKGLSTAVGDEGGFAPELTGGTKEALELLMLASEKAGYKPKEEIEIALDAAASEFYDSEKNAYMIDGKELSSGELSDYYADLIKDFPIVSVEDSHNEDDFDGFKNFTAKLGDKVQVVGDDLFVTNPKRLKMGIDEKLANSILIKVNQIGTITETLAAIKMAKENGFGTIISHRSGETEDSFIADLAVGTSAGQIKTGSLSRSDRTAKYNQLLRISQVL